MISLLIMLLSIPTSFAGPAPLVLDRFATRPEENLECKALDYSSYFQAEKSKGNIQSLNPDLRHPNFAGHYLLLKNELLMETLWFVADCNTGKFFHEKLSGKAHFSIRSQLVELAANSDKDPEVESLIWEANAWVKVDASPTPAPSTSASTSPGSPAPVAAPSLNYASLFQAYPSEASLDRCVSLDFSSFHRAFQGKENIKKSNPNLETPNFNGHYLLLKNELMFETLWFLADCKTGKFSNLVLSGEPQFKKDSSFILVRESKKFSRLFRFNDNNLIELNDPVQKNHQSVKNSLSDTDAETFFNLIPNPGKLNLLRFEKVVAAENQGTLILNGKPANIEATHLKTFLELMKKWGKKIEGSGETYQIDSGRCSHEKKIATCDIENNGE